MKVDQMSIRALSTLAPCFLFKLGMPYCSCKHYYILIAQKQGTGEDRPVGHLYFSGETKGTWFPLLPMSVTDV